MKILFIYPDIIYPHIPKLGGTYYTGIGYLSAVLKKAGHETHLLHITHPANYDEFKGWVSVVNPDVVAFSSTTNMFLYVEEWAKWVKEIGDVPTICGGIHPTLNPDEVINKDGINFICRGEGEEALVELCDKLEKGEDLSEIRNIWWKRNGDVFKNEPRTLIEDLDRLPFPDREIFNHPELEASREGIGIFMASRGCPYDCSYCCNRALSQVCPARNKSKYVRFRSVENVLKEIEETLNSHPYIRIIHFDDDILPLNRRWFEEFATKYRNHIGLPLRCNLRPDLLDEHMIKLLKDAGCEQVALGIESGNDEIRQKVLNRPISRKRLIDAFSRCKDAGIKTYSFNMVGLPFESTSRILDTVKLNAQISPDRIQVSIFYPYKGTRLYKVCKENGWLDERIIGSYFAEDTLLSQPHLSKDAIVFYKNFFSLLVKLYRIIFRLPLFLSNLGVKILDKMVFIGERSKISFKLSNAIFSSLRAIKHRIYS